jgi:two-component system, NarL family, response regulator
MTDENVIRIMVADDHPLLREGLVSLLGRQPDMKVVAEAENGNQALVLYRQHHPDVTLMDLRMPGMTGLEATTVICKESPNAKIIVLTTYDGDEDIYRALHAGAKSYLLKEMPRKDLLDAIRNVHAGKLQIPPEVAARLAERVYSSELSERELDVLKLIVKGKGNKEIGSLLNLTEGTVKSYIHHIFSKLGVTDRTEAATLALQRGIVHLE